MYGDFNWAGFLICVLIVGAVIAIGVEHASLFLWRHLRHLQWMR